MNLQIALLRPTQFADPAHCPPIDFICVTLRVIQVIYLIIQLRSFQCYRESNIKHTKLLTLHWLSTRVQWRT